MSSDFNLDQRDTLTSLLLQKDLARFKDLGLCCFVTPSLVSTNTDFDES